MNHKYNNQKYDDVISIISRFGEIPTCKTISRKDIISHIDKLYEDLFRKYLLGKYSRNLHYENLDHLKTILYGDITEYRKNQDGEVVRYILDYLLEELGNDIFGRENKEKMNMEIKKSIRGRIIVDKELSEEVEKLILSGIDYKSLMEKLGITRITHLKSLLYEVSTILGKVVSIDTETSQTHKYGNDYVRVCKSGLYMTKNKMNKNIEGGIEVGTWFRMKISKSSSKGKLTITLEEETEE